MRGVDGRALFFAKPCQYARIFKFGSFARFRAMPICARVDLTSPQINRIRGTVPLPVVERRRDRRKRREAVEWHIFAVRPYNV